MLQVLTELMNINSGTPFIKRQKVGYFGHVLHGPKYEFTKLIIQRKIEDVHRGPGRKMSWLQNVHQWTVFEIVQELKRAVENQEI